MGQLPLYFARFFFKKLAQASEKIFTGLVLLLQRGGFGRYLFFKVLRCLPFFPEKPDG